MCQVSDLYHEEVMLGYCLWRGYAPAGETYWLCSLFAPVRELAGGCSWKQDDETGATTTRYATTLVASHRPDAVEWLSKLSMKLWECSKRTTTRKTWTLTAPTIGHTTCRFVASIAETIRTCTGIGRLKKYTVCSHSATEWLLLMSLLTWLRIPSEYNSNATFSWQLSATSSLVPVAPSKWTSGAAIYFWRSWTPTHRQFADICGTGCQRPNICSEFEWTKLDSCDKINTSEMCVNGRMVIMYTERIAKKEVGPNEKSEDRNEVSFLDVQLCRRP